ncbi:protein RIC-3 [Mixophyes fleayi]|uniref:protein RIC-3 n=1 Tax=Mixophyes fleayi TaxID=3061075 RepID=UPI003F4E34C2
MALSTIQRVALFSGLVLCVSLLLPKTFLSRGKQSGQQEGNPGRFSAVPHGKPADGRTAGNFFPRSHLSEAVSKAKTGGGGGGGGGGGKQSLVGQIIPIYGFGILLYILYILFKLSSKGKSTKLEPRSVPIANGNLKRKITDYELSQLQDKLKETEETMEKMISRLGPNSERVDNVSTTEEQQLLERLKEITRVMQEGKILDGVSPEQEAEEAPYMESWEGYPEETYPIYDPSDHKQRQNTIFVDCSVLTQPSAEEIAEQMEFAEVYDRLYTKDPEDDGYKGVPEYKLYTDPPRGSIITPEGEDCASDSAEAWGDSEDEEDDPAVIAENAGFSSDSCGEGDPYVGDPVTNSATDGESPGPVTNPNQDETGTVRKRSKKPSEY